MSRWSEDQKTALIESILLSIPIPPIFVAEDKDGVWELDKWTLQEGGLVKSLEGFNVDNLPTNLRLNLKRAICRVEILRGESSTSMKYELFKRLNSAGSKLTPQEIRNAIYRGINPRLNELLLTISQSDVFKILTKLSPSKLNELYDQELVLRFFAFYKNARNVNENMEKFLNNFMENTVKDSSFDYDGYEFVPAYFEGILIGVAQNIKQYTENIELLKLKIIQLKNDKDFFLKLRELFLQEDTPYLQNIKIFFPLNQYRFDPWFVQRSPIISESLARPIQAIQGIPKPIVPRKEVPQSGVSLLSPCQHKAHNKEKIFLPQPL